MERPVCDSIIFDMDGTLWDAVDSYTHVWNHAFEALGSDLRTDRQTLMSYMGKPIDVIFDGIVGNRLDKDEFMRRLAASEREIMPREGGRLYPGVADGLRLLSSRKKLFIVSNCGKTGLPEFLDFTGLRPFFTGWLAYGDTGMGKEKNIPEIIRRYGLTNPIYVGDTESDCISAHAAGVPMIHVTYGFGEAPDAEWHATNFPAVVDLTF